LNASNVLRHAPRSSLPSVPGGVQVYGYLSEHLAPRLSKSPFSPGPIGQWQPRGETRLLSSMRKLGKV
jgi:hypothetical protein